MQLLTKTIRRKIVSSLRHEYVCAIKQQYNHPASLLCKKRWVFAACLRCAEPRCINFVEDEIVSHKFGDFSYERDVNVCPVGAIRWDAKLELPQINNEKCIGCGLCALRCPIGAIYRDEGQMAVAEPEYQDYIELPFEQANVEAQKEFIRKLDKISWTRQFQAESDSIMSEIYEKVSLYDGRSKVADILVRNLFILLDHECAIRRTGVAHIRMDAVYASRNPIECVGAIEIEFSKDTLEAARNMLDNIAVMHSRFNLDKQNNTALVVCLSFPNRRQGYFQVIKDVNKVLNIQIQTISLGALLLLAWNGGDVDFRDRAFYVDFDNLTIRDIIANHLNRKICLSDGKLGILEPEK